jgi:hypothetical protein
MDWQTYGYQPNSMRPYSIFIPSPQALNGSDGIVYAGAWNDRSTQLYTQGFLPNYTYQCGKPFVVQFKFFVNACYNDQTDVWGNLYFGDLSGSIPLYQMFHNPGGGNHDALQTYFSQGTLTAPASIQPQKLSGYLEQHLGWYQENKDPHWQDRIGGSWKYTAIPLKNNCDLIPETCSCSGRTQVCTKAGLPSSTTPNSPSCQLQATCSATAVATDTENVTFTQSATNVQGTLSYKDIIVLANGQTQEVSETNPTKTMAILPGQTVVKRTRVTDSGDGASATTLCTVQRPTAATITSSCVGRDKVFTNKTTGLETSRIKNEPTCALSASCTAESNGDNVIFRLSATNSYEVPVFKDVASSEVLNAVRTVPIAKGQTISQTVTATDRSDQSSVQTTCSFVRPANPGVTTSCSCAVNGTRTCTYSDGSAPSVVPGACTVNTICACSGRNLVCRNANNASQIISTTNNDAQCAFSASCDITRDGTSNIATVNHYVQNALGTVSFRDGGTASGAGLVNPFTKQIPVQGTLTQNTLVTDTDGSNVVTQCSISDQDVQTCNCEGTSRVCRYANGTAASTVKNSNMCPIRTYCEGTTLIQRNATGLITGRIANSPQCTGPGACACEGRSLVCRNGSGSVTGTTANASQCSFSATCTGQVVNNEAVFTQILTNALGNATYKNTATGVLTGNPSSEPISLGQTITRNTLITDTSDGKTVTTQCTVTKNDTAQPKCGCEGRDMVCKDSKGGLISSSVKDSFCAFTAVCLSPTIDEGGNTASFLYNFTNRLGTATYKDQANPSSAFSNVVSIAPGGSIVRQIAVTDGYDNSVSVTTCVATRAPNTSGCEPSLGWVVRNASGIIVSSDPEDARCKIVNANYQCACEGNAGEVRVCRDVATGVAVTPEVASTLPIAPLVCPIVPPEDGVPQITFFRSVPAVVQKGSLCNYVWSTANLNRCTLKINNVDIPLTSLGTTVGSIVSFSRTTAGSDANQQAVLTCEKDATTMQPLKKVVMSTTCSVNPGLIQR